MAPIGATVPSYVVGIKGRLAQLLTPGQTTCPLWVPLQKLNVVDTRYIHFKDNGLPDGVFRTLPCTKGQSIRIDYNGDLIIEVTLEGKRK